MIEILIKIIIGMVILVTTSIMGLLFLGIDRKLAARFQSRVGPPIIQSFRDFIKLLSKQTIIPDRSVSWIYNFMPILALTSVFLLIFYLPFFGIKPLLYGHGDLVVVLYLILLPSLAMVIGGLSSGNNYAIVGAQRKMVMMMSYELPLAILVVTIAWKLSTDKMNSLFSFSTFFQDSIFTLLGPIGIIGMILLFLTMLWSLSAEVIKGPFDNPEAETEIAEGIMVDYSGRNYAMFMLTDAIKLVAFITLMIGLFFPYKIINFGIWSVFLGAALYFIKFFILMFIGLTFTRVAFARLKINQATKFFWVWSTGIGILGMLLVWIDMLV